VGSGRKYDHITPLLHDLHWLPFPERITFRLAVLAYRCQHGLAPTYLAYELHWVADDDSRGPTLKNKKSGQENFKKS